MYIVSYFVHSMLSFWLATEVTEFPLLIFDFYTVLTEWQEQGAIDWLVHDRKRKKYIVLCHSFGEESMLLTSNYMCQKENMTSDF